VLRAWAQVLLSSARLGQGQWVKEPAQAVSDLTCKLFYSRNGRMQVLHVFGQLQQQYRLRFACEMSCGSCGDDTDCCFARRMSQVMPFSEVVWASANAWPLTGTFARHYTIPPCNIHTRCISQGSWEGSMCRDCFLSCTLCIQM
jgi:hypothetical protein